MLRRICYVEYVNTHRKTRNVSSNCVTADAAYSVCMRDPQLNSCSCRKSIYLFASGKMRNAFLQIYPELLYEFVSRYICVCKFHHSKTTYCDGERIGTPAYTNKTDNAWDYRFGNAVLYWRSYNWYFIHNSNHISPFT